MATVVGKTSVKIDELLSNLLVGADIVDGHLLIETRSGAVTDVGGVGDTGSICRILYSAGVWPSRPTGYANVEWVGPTQPPSMLATDTWVDTS